MCEAILGQRLAQHVERFEEDFYVAGPIVRVGSGLRLLASSP